MGAVGRRSVWPRARIPSFVVRPSPCFDRAAFVIRCKMFLRDAIVMIMMVILRLAGYTDNAKRSVEGEWRFLVNGDTKQLESF